MKKKILVKENKVDSILSQMKDNENTHVILVVDHFDLLKDNISDKKYRKYE